MGGGGRPWHLSKLPCSLASELGSQSADEETQHNTNQYGETLKARQRHGALS